MIAGLTWRMFVLVSLPLGVKSLKRCNSTKDCTGVEWHSPAVLLNLKFSHLMCLFILDILLFGLVPFFSHVSALRVSDDKTASHRRNSSHSNRNKIFTVIDFLTAHQSGTSVRACLFMCPSVHTLRQGLTALLCVLCLRLPAVQSVLRESQVICESKEKQIAELKKMSDQSADSLKNEWEKKVWG